MHRYAYHVRENVEKEEKTKLEFEFMHRVLKGLKDDFHSVLRSLRPQCLWGSQTNRFYSLRTAYLIFEAHFKFFFQQFPWVLQLWSLFIKWYQKEWRIKLPIDSGGWHETLNLLHVSRCEMLHFVTSYMKQNKSRKQTLESAQNGLETILKSSEASEK